MNLSTVKWDQWGKTQSRELLGLFICVCIALCTIVAHNIAQNRPDSFPPYPPDNHHCSNDVYLRERGIHRRHRRKEWWTRILTFKFCDFLRIFQNFQKGVARCLCGRPGPLWSWPNYIRVGSLWPSFIKIGQRWRVEVQVRDRQTDRQTRLKIRVLRVCNQAKNVKLFSAPLHVKSKPDHTCHGDREGPYNSCTPNFSSFDQHFRVSLLECSNFGEYTQMHNLHNCPPLKWNWSN